MTKGVLLRIFVLEGQRHHGELLYDWLLRRAREMGIPGGAAFREIAGYGRDDRLHEQSFFELAGDLPVEVAFAMTESDSQRFLDLLAREMPSQFYIKSSIERRPGHHPLRPPGDQQGRSGTSLAVMERDAKRMRGTRPFVFSNLRAGRGIDEIARFIEDKGGLRASNKGGVESK